MPYEFTEWEQEPEPQASSGHSTIPPRKFTAIGLLDPPVPPKKPPGPILNIPASTLVRILVILVLAGLLVSIVSTFLLIQ